MPSRLTLALVVAALATLPAAAQIRAAGSGSAGMGINAGSPGMGHGGLAGGSGRFHGSFHRRQPGDRGAVLLGYPDFYSDSDYSDSGEASQPQVIVVQAAAPAPAPAPPAPRESLLIEWQGDHFVRSTASAKAAEIAPDYAEKSSVPGPATRRSLLGPENKAQPPRELPPAVLVFRDGRQEEVSEYTIMSGTIYSKADYWTTGSWTRKIQIADLDVPATLKLNQQRGLKFALPSSSNEVVVRP